MKSQERMSVYEETGQGLSGACQSGLSKGRLGFMCGEVDESGA